MGVSCLTAQHIVVSRHILVGHVGKVGIAVIMGFDAKIWSMPSSHTWHQVGYLLVIVPLQCEVDIFASCPVC